jgi:putative membrane protein
VNHTTGEYFMTNVKRAGAGLIAGAVGGLAGAFMMNRVPPFWSAAYRWLTRHEGSLQEAGGGDEDVEATRNAAQAVSKHVYNRTLSTREMKFASPALHYGIGTLMGAVYGVAAEALPMCTVGRGTVYGGAVWLVADEIAMPAFGLLGSLSDTPLSSQISALASHVVYGFATDTVRRMLLETKTSTSPGGFPEPRYTNGWPGRGCSRVWCPPHL